MITTYQQAQKQFSSTVAYIGSAGRRAFGAVVFELADDRGQVKRTVVVRTGSSKDRALDTARTQRTASRLRALGFRHNWSALGHPQDGVCGTVRMFRA